MTEEQLRIIDATIREGFNKMSEILERIVHNTGRAADGTYVESSSYIPEHSPLIEQRVAKLLISDGERDA